MSSSCRVCRSPNAQYECDITGFRLCGIECYKKGVAPFIAGKDGLKRQRGDNDDERIQSGVFKLNVGGTIFTTLRSTLQKYDGSILAVMADPEREMRFTQDENGLPFIDADPEVFRLVLFWLRTGEKPIEYENNESVKRELRRLLDYLLLLDAWESEDEVLQKKVIYMVRSWDGVTYGPTGGKYVDKDGSPRNGDEKAAAALHLLLSKPNSKLLGVGHSGQAAYWVIQMYE